MKLITTGMLNYFWENAMLLIKKIAGVEEATPSTSGILSAADKKKLDGIAEEANKTTVDSALKSNSTNPVQNINDTAATEIYTYGVVGSVRCV